MLLPEKVQALEHLSGPYSGSVQARPQINVLSLQLGDSGATHGPLIVFLQFADASFGLKSAPAEGRELLPKVMDEVLQLTEGDEVSLLAVGHRAHSPALEVVWTGDLRSP